MTTLALGIPTVRRSPSAAPSVDGRPDVAGLVDRFGRVARDLRVSVTDAAIAVSRLETMGLVVDSGGWFESTRSLLRGSKVAGP